MSEQDVAAIAQKPSNFEKPHGFDCVVMVDMPLIPPTARLSSATDGASPALVSEQLGEIGLTETPTLQAENAITSALAFTIIRIVAAHVLSSVSQN